MSALPDILGRQYVIETTLNESDGNDDPCMQSEDHVRDVDFARHGAGVQVACQVVDAVGQKPTPIQHGEVHGVTLYTVCGLLPELVVDVELRVEAEGPTEEVNPPNDLRQYRQGLRHYCSPS